MTVRDWRGDFGGDGVPGEVEWLCDGVTVREMDWLWEIRSERVWWGDFGREGVTVGDVECLSGRDGVTVEETGWLWERWSDWERWWWLWDTDRTTGRDGGTGGWLWEIWGDCGTDGMTVREMGWLWDWRSDCERDGLTFQWEEDSRVGAAATTVFSSNHNKRQFSGDVYLPLSNFTEWQTKTDPQQMAVFRGHLFATLKLHWITNQNWPSNSSSGNLPKQPPNVGETNQQLLLVWQ